MTTSASTLSTRPTRGDRRGHGERREPRDREVHADRDAGSRRCEGGARSRRSCALAALVLAGCASTALAPPPGAPASDQQGKPGQPGKQPGTQARDRDGAPAGTLKVMPLGDSITAGFPTADGYRLRLWERAQAAHLDMHLVGSQRGGSEQLPEPAHEGHPHWQIEQLNAEVAGFLEAEHPDVVLLMIGTNDIFDQHDVAGAPARLEVLLRHIGAAAPQVSLIVGSIPPLRSMNRGDVAVFNAAIPAIVKRLARSGQRIRFADVGSKLTLDDIDPDNVHPAPSGYKKLADGWFEALRAR